jgi:hypothetical protein
VNQRRKRADFSRLLIRSTRIENKQPSLSSTTVGGSSEAVVIEWPLTKGQIMSQVLLHPAYEITTEPSGEQLAGIKAEERSDIATKERVGERAPAIASPSRFVGGSVGRVSAPTAGRRVGGCAGFAYSIASAIRFVGGSVGRISARSGATRLVGGSVGRIELPR